MSKGLKRFVQFCCVCWFFNLMQNGDVDLAGALIETADNMIAELRSGFGSVDWGLFFGSLQRGAEGLFSFVRSL